MTTDDASVPAHDRWIPHGIVGLGVAVLVVQTAVQVVYGDVTSLLTLGGFLSVALTAAFGLPVVGGGIWLHRGNVAPARFRRVAAWCVGLLVVVLTINLVMIAAWPQSPGQNVSWAVQAAQMGAAGGVLFGSIEARAIERARAAERAQVRSAELDAQREWLNYLNSLLRHEVLNTANVVVGYADLILEDFEGDERTRDRLERIARQSRKMTDVIQDVRLLIQATDGEVTTERVDVVEVVDAELAALEDRYGAVDAVLDAPEAAHVVADDLVARVFSNVLSNAIEHNDADAPRVHVSVEANPESVRVEVADNGPGVPEEERDSLFEPSGRGDHGLGLYLVRTLLSRYGGTIALRETGPDGSVFAIEIPRPSSEPPVAEGADAGAVAPDPT